MNDPNNGFSLSYKPKPVKKCPRCTTGQLLVKTNNNTQQQFLGCSEFPLCKFTEPLPIDMQMRLQGAPTLPGLE